MRHAFALAALLFLLVAGAKQAWAQAIPCDVQPSQPACVVEERPKRPKLNLFFEFRPAKPATQPKQKPQTTTKPKPAPKTASKPAPKPKPKPVQPPKRASRPAPPAPSWLGLPETPVPVLAGSDFDDIEGQFIVDFDTTAFTAAGIDLLTISVADLAARLGLEPAAIRSVQRVFMLSAVIRATQSERTALEANPLVATIHNDIRIRAAGGKAPPLSWGLDRLDRPTLPMDGAFEREGGAYAARLYVLDSGIDARHAEFGGRVAWGARFARHLPDTSGHCRDHGTEMASLIGGRTTGSAPKVEIVDVVVLPCSRHATGEGSSLVEAAEWLLLRERELGETKPVIVNMSLAGKWSRKINDAVAVMTRNNVAVVVAAGNNGADACRFSPASARDAVTVAATAPDDTIPGFSNHGACVDIHAPGKLVTAVSEGAQAPHVAVSGTSGASALVAGLLARAIRQKGPKAAAEWLADAGAPQDIWLAAGSPGKGLVLAQMNNAWRQTCRLAALARTAKLRDRPGPAGREIGTVQPGAELTVETAANDWARIKIDGRRGWIKLGADGGAALSGPGGATPCVPLQ